MIINIYYSSNNAEGFNHPIEGNIVIDTTSVFSFDNLAGCFSQDTNKTAVVEVVHIGKDYSDYDADKCHDGGKYGYDFYKIVKVLGTGNMF